MRSHTHQRFADVLDALYDAVEVEDDRPAPSLPFQLMAEPGKTSMPAASVEDAYRALVLDELEARLSSAGVHEAGTAPPEPRAMDVSMPSINPADIAAELALDGVRDLPAARRRFAFDNHPDRVATHLRERAQLRMQIANTLIDEAARQRRKSRLS
jgi:nucleotide-binding universal stress UspA family protein